MKPKIKIFLVTQPYKFASFKRGDEVFYPVEKKSIVKGEIVPIPGKSLLLVECLLSHVIEAFSCVFVIH